VVPAALAAAGVAFSRRASGTMRHGNSRVIKAGGKWTFVWQQAGNNGDGIVGIDDGACWWRKNDSSRVMKLRRTASRPVAYSDTHTGGAFVDELEGRSVHRRSAVCT